MNKLIKAMMDMGVKGLTKTAGIEDIAFQAVFFIGPAGSGKSFVRSKRYLKYMRFRIIDPDEVKKMHPDYDPENPFKVHDYSKEISNAEYAETVTSGTGEPVVVDGTGKKAGNIIKKAKLARANGYRIFLVYVWVPWEVSIFRNRNRERFVPEDIVMEQVEKVNKTFGVLKSIVDKFKVIQNYSNADAKEAKADIELYPAPQSKRPPRPGDADYGQQKAASVKTAGNKHVLFWQKQFNYLDSKFKKYDATRVTDWNKVEKYYRSQGIPSKIAGIVAHWYHEMRVGNIDRHRAIKGLVKDMAKHEVKIQGGELKKFMDYFFSFYGEDGLYPIEGLTEKDVVKGIKLRLDNHPDVPWDGDTTDREFVRDEVLRWRKMRKSSEDGGDEIAAALVELAKVLGG